MKMKEQDKLTENYLKVLGLIKEQSEAECQKPGCDPECGGSDDPKCGGDNAKKSRRSKKGCKGGRCGDGEDSKDEPACNEAADDEDAAEGAGVDDEDDRGDYDLDKAFANLKDDDDDDERDSFDYDLFPDDPEEGESRKEDLDAELTDVITQMVDDGKLGEDEADGCYDRLHCALDSADISDEDAEYWLNLVKSNGEAAEKLAKLITAIGRCE